MPFRQPGENKVLPEEDETTFAPEPVAPEGAGGARSTVTLFYLLLCHFLVALWARYAVDIWNNFPESK